NIKANYNTVIVIVHDLLVIQEADEIIEMGPGAGVSGGEVIYQGEREGLKEKETSTNLDHTLKINASPRQAEALMDSKEANNNKNINIQIPEQVLVSVSGVSCSGKSSLMLEAFAKDNPEAIMVDQGRVGISSRSTLATYMGIMDDIRGTFAKASGEPPGLFS